MKKLTKSMKIVLISVVSAVCVAGIVLGCVFGFRKNNGTDPLNPNNPSTPENPIVEKLLTWDEQLALLGREIDEKDSSTSKYTLINGQPFDGYIGENEKLYSLTSNYFVVEHDSRVYEDVYDEETGETNKTQTGGEYKKYYYGYSQNKNGSFNVVKINTSKNNGGLIETENQNNISSIFEDEKIIVFSVSDDKDYLHIYDTQTLKIISVVPYEMNEDFGIDFEVSKNHTILNIYIKGVENSFVIFVNLLNGKYYYEETYQSTVEVSYQLFDNFIIKQTENEYKIYSFSETDLLNVTFNQQNNETLKKIFQISQNELVIEILNKVSTASDKSIIIENKNGTNSWGEYSYKVAKLNGNSLSFENYNTGKFAKIENEEIVNSNNFYKLNYYIVDADHNLVLDSSKVIYKTGSLVFEYVGAEEILMISENSVLTRCKLFKVTENEKVISREMLNEFISNTTEDASETSNGILLCFNDSNNIDMTSMFILYSKKVGKFILSSDNNQKLGLYDKNGNLLIEDNEVINDLSNTDNQKYFYAFGKSNLLFNVNGEYKYISYNNLKLEKVADAHIFEQDEIQTKLKDDGLFFIDFNGKIALCDFDGVLCDNIDEIEYKNLDNATFIVLKLSNNHQSFLKINNIKFSLSNKENQNKEDEKPEDNKYSSNNTKSIPEISPYSKTYDIWYYGTSWTQWSGHETQDSWMNDWEAFHWGYKISFTLAPSSLVSKTGYTFSKWALGSTSGTQYSAGGTYEAYEHYGSGSNFATSGDNDIDFYAIWTENKYRVYYYFLNSNATSHSDSKSDVYSTYVTGYDYLYSGSYNLTAYSTIISGKTSVTSDSSYGWSFYGWHNDSGTTDNSRSKTDSADFSKLNSSSNGTKYYYAKYSRTPYLKYNLNKPSGSTVDVSSMNNTNASTQYLAYGGSGVYKKASSSSASSVSCAFKIRNYSFLGWATAYNGSPEGLKSYSWNSTDKKERNLYAIWIYCIFTVKVNYNWNSKHWSGETDSQYYIPTDSSRVELDTKFYTFRNSTDKIKFSTNEFTIYYYYLGKNGNYWFSDSQGNSSLSSLYVPTRLGYTFQGYYLSDGTCLFNSSGGKTNVNYLTTKNADKAGGGNIEETIYAKWSANTISVEFVYTDGNSNGYVIDSKNVIKKQNLQKVEGGAISVVTQSPNTSTTMKIAQISNSTIKATKLKTYTDSYSVTGYVDNLNSSKVNQFTNSTSSGVYLPNSSYRLAGYVIGGLQYIDYSGSGGNQSETKYSYYKINSNNKSGNIVYGTLNSYTIENQGSASAKLTTPGELNYTLEECLYYGGFTGNKIKLYAVYEVRGLDVGLETVASSGSVSNDTSDLHQVRLDAKYGITFSYKTTDQYLTSETTPYEYTKEGNPIVNGGSATSAYIPKIAIGSSVDFRIQVTDSSGLYYDDYLTGYNNSGTQLYTTKSDDAKKINNSQYRFNRLSYRISVIELTNLPYYTGSSFKLGTLRIVFNESSIQNNGSSYSITLIENTKTSNVFSSYAKLIQSDEGDFTILFTKKVSGDPGYALDASASSYNVITISNFYDIDNPHKVATSSFNVKVENINYGNSGSGNSISDDTRLQSGTKAFGLKVYSTPIAETMDSFTITTAETASNLNEYINTDTTNMPNGGYIATQATKPEDGNIYTFWVNGYRFETSSSEGTFSKSNAKNAGDGNNFSFYYYIQEYTSGKYFAYISIKGSDALPNRDSLNSLNSNIRTNFGSTGIYFIEPNQSIIYSSKSATEGLNKTSYYEPNSYLSSIVIKNSSGSNLVEFKNLVLQKDIDSLSHIYSTYSNTNSPKIMQEISSGTTYTYNDVTSKDLNNTILGNDKLKQFKYNGTDYKIVQIIDLYSGGNSDTVKNRYTLYLGFCETNHKILYILTANGNDDFNNMRYVNNQTNNNTITFTMKKYDYKVDITYSVPTGERIPEDSDNVKHYINAEVMNIVKKDTYTSFSMENNSNGKNTITGLTPTSGMIIRLSPQDGYLINNLIVKLNKGKATGTTLANVNLNEVTMYRTNGNDTAPTLFNGDVSGDDTSTKLGIAYTGSGNILSAFNVPGGDQQMGIYYSRLESSTWGSLSDKFETVYLFISGVYGDVDIKVQTISYMEYDFVIPSTYFTGNGYLSGTDAEKRANDFLDHISIARITESGYEEFLPLTTYSSKPLKVNYSPSNFTQAFKCEYNSEKDFYRLVFIGYAEYFQRGIAFFMSGSNYSYYLKNAKYYNQQESATKTPFNNSLSVKTNSNGNQTLSTIGETQFKFGYNNSTELRAVYYEVHTNSDPSDSLINHFTSSEIPTGNNEHLYLHAKKWVLLFQVTENKTLMESTSYLSYNEIDKADNPFTKEGTWFNDTTLTNIEYYYRGNRNATVSNYNWQDNFAPNHNADVVSKNIYGYDVHLEYYVIPGYYLNNITIRSNPSQNNGNIQYSIKIDGTVKNYLEETKTVSGSIPSSSNKYYYTYYFRFDDDASKYDIYLYAMSYNDAASRYESSSEFGARKDCLSLLASDFVIDIYSMPYQINVNFNPLDPNASDTNISSVNRQYPNDPNKNTLKMFEYDKKNGNNTKDLTLTEGKYTAVYYYDQISTIKEYAEMVGYTFIGWGSQKYYSSESGHSYTSRYSRTTEGLNTWNTVSSWTDLTNYFGKSASNRAGLLSLVSNDKYSSDFYIKGGYFVTDTGYKSGTSQRAYGNVQEQNYNFLSAYVLNSFLVLGRTDDNVFENDGKEVWINDAFKYNISLYGIWKVNTYYVSLNLNDARVNLPGTSIKNGSTSANSSQKVGGTLKSFILAGSATSGIILPELSGTSRFSYGETEASKISYDLFVTFDTNKWYMLDKNGSNSDKPFSINLSNGAVYSNLFKNSNNYVDFTQFIIDRYGYTWLGWFSEQLSNVFEQNDYYSTKMLSTYPTKDNSSNNSTNKKAIWTTQTYRKDNPTASTTFAAFNYTSYKGIFGTTNIHELNDNVSNDFHLNYYRDPDYYKGKYKLGTENTENPYRTQYFGAENNSADGLYFYVYSPSGGFANDYYNTYYSNKVNTYLKDASGNNIQLNVTYYDTLLDYNYYKYNDARISTQNAPQYTFFYMSEYQDNDLSETKVNTFRYVTLYAYWQTNLYQINVNMRDAGSQDTIGGKMGSSTVQRTNNPSNGQESQFLPAYFDDHTYLQRFNSTENSLYSRVKTYLPVRVGYDFVGWTFMTSGNNIIDIYSDENYNVGSLEKYLYLNYNLLNYLYTTDNGAPNGQLANSIDTLPQVKEKLGDNETVHMVYMFAIWSVQSFTINTSLDISGENLSNLYDFDSEFALALYGSADNRQSYSGIDTKYLKQNQSGKHTFTDISANIQFVVDFDQNLSTAKLVVNGTASNYTIFDLYSTSMGYYFTGWSLKYNDGTEYKLIENNSKPSYDANGRLITELQSNLVFDVVEHDILFDVTLYNNIKSLYIEKFENVNTETGHSVINKEEQLNQKDFFNYRQTYQYTTDYTGNTYKYYKTITNSANNSTNFGYFIVNYSNDERTYYINYGLRKNANNEYVSYMYFVDKSGNKITVVPYIQLTDSDTPQIANVVGSSLTYDRNNFYYNNTIVNFDNTGAYYVLNSYGFSGNGSENIKRLKLYFAVLNNGAIPNADEISTYIISGDIGRRTISSNCTAVTTKLVKTRQFTVYADWELKENLNIEVSNANIGTAPDSFYVPTALDDPLYTMQNQNANLGLAGYYYIQNTSKHLLDTPKDKVKSTSGDSEQSINMTYDFYDDLYLFISPYYNGRFLSTISFTFYTYEQKAGTGTTIFSKVEYKLTIKFVWDSVNHVIKISSWDLWKTEIGTATKLFNGNVSNGATIADGPTNDLNKNDLFVKDISILSILDQTSFARNTQTKFMEISQYITGLLNYGEFVSSVDTNGHPTDPKIYNLVGNSYEIDDGRTDVNYIQIRLNDLMTSVNISCEFSVQTYDLEVYNVFDSLGDNLKLLENGHYSVADDDLDIFLSNTKSVYSGSGLLSTYTDTFPDTVTKTAFNTSNITATIKQNVSSSQYNIPYGMYIYGKYYSETTRPYDVNYEATTGIGYNRSQYTGYDYLYKYGIYEYGKGSAGRIKNNGIDNFSDQFFPILGSKTNFARSIRESSALYQFAYWFVPVVLDDTFELVEYDKNHEATMINNNTTVIGYYYASNKPTNIDFYTWNDDTYCYEKYENNIEEYTLNKNDNGEDTVNFVNDKVELVLKGTAEYYTDEDGNVLLTNSEKLGIDGTGFGKDSYKRKEIEASDENEEFLETNVIRNYWYYEFRSMYIYFDTDEIINGISTRVNHKIKYSETAKPISANGVSSLTHFYYLKNENALDKEENRTYVQLFSTNLKDEMSVTINPNTNLYVVGDINNQEQFATKMIEARSYGVDFVEARLEYEQKYYLVGSDMYAYTAPNGSDEIGKYYKIHKIEDYEQDPQLNPDEKTLLSTFFHYDISGKPVYEDVTARFYVKIHNELYYLIATTASESHNAEIFYKYGHDTFTSIGKTSTVTYHENETEKYSVVLSETDRYLKPISNYMDDSITPTDKAKIKSIMDNNNLAKKPIYYVKDTKAEVIYYIFGNSFELTANLYSISYNMDYYTVKLSNYNQEIKTFNAYEITNDSRLNSLETERQLMLNMLNDSSMKNKPTHFVVDTVKNVVYYLRNSEMPESNFSSRLYIYIADTLPEQTFDLELNLFIDAGFVKTNDSLEVRNLDYYFMKINDNYYPVEFTEFKEYPTDAYSSTYFNPYVTTNTCDYVIEYTVIYNQNNTDKYSITLNDKTRIVRKIESYTIEDETTRGIIGQILSNPNIKKPTFYVKDPSVGTNGTIYYMFMDDFRDGETQKNTFLYTFDGEKFVKSSDRCYLNYNDKLFYTDAKLTERLITRTFNFKAYTPVNNNYSVQLSLPTATNLDDDHWDYIGVTINSLPAPNIGFWYNNSTYKYVGYVNFTQEDLEYIANTSSSFDQYTYEYVNVYNEDGTIVYENGEPKQQRVLVQERIVDVFENYINIVFANKSESVREELLHSAQEQCVRYGKIEVMRKVFITANEFYTSSKANSNSVEKVNLIIPITLMLTCSEGTYSATVSVKYKTTIITKSTKIDKTIYAIPIYSRNVMEFTANSVEQVSNKISISINDMYVNFFENVGNIDTRYYNAADGNYLEFAILNKTQFKLLKESDDYSGQLTYMLKNYSIIQLHETMENKVLTEDFSRTIEDREVYEDGDYYIVAYYKKMGDYDYVIRSSDNLIKVTVTNGSLTSYTIGAYSDFVVID